jgi:glyoxylase-like metal-dependent hydrolase (beta-lactamase superfamily II)
MACGIIFLIGFQNSIADQSRREIKQVSGDLYSVHDGNNTYAAFLVTSEGIILTDPIDPETAAWLNMELEQRFGLPVKYLVYSHSHYDHSAGAKAFDQAIIVGHENVIPEFDIWNDLSLPFAAFDAPGGDLDRLEAFRANNPIVYPDITFNDRLTIDLGGKKVNLIYLGKGHSDNLLAVHYPEERAVLTIDLLWIDRVAYGNMVFRYWFPDLLDGLRMVEQMDFDILVTGHGTPGTGSGVIGTREDVTEFREYYDALYAAVVVAIENGLSREQAVASIELPEFSHLGMYDHWFEGNVDGVYRNLMISRQERKQ